MSRRPRLSSWLASYFDRFVSLRRATGARYDTQVLLLEAFDRYLLKEVPGPPLGQRHVLGYIERLGRLSPRARDNAICVIWQAVTYAQLHGASVDPLPVRPRPAPARLRVRPPRLVTLEEVRAVLETARGLPPPKGLRAATITTLVGLLWTTGIRIGEALSLDVGDFDPAERLLTVRHGKFGKARILPLKTSTMIAVRDYLDHPERVRGSTASSSPLFVSGLRRRLSYPAAAGSFQAAVSKAGITRDRAPRFHDLRHSFAVHRVATWYAEGRGVDRLLPALSTYLGHVSIEHTRCYLQANGALLEHASRLFEAQTVTLDGGAR